MAWDPYDAWLAAVDAGMLHAVDFTVGSAVYPGIYVKWFQPDGLYFDNSSQQTDYHIEFRTIDLPNLTAGSTLVSDGRVYRCKTMPAFSANKSGGHFSTVRLERIGRTYPKLPVGALPPPLASDCNLSWQFDTADSSISIGIL